MKMKLSKEELKETAIRAVKILEAQVNDYYEQAKLIQAKVDDLESKIRWLRREVIDTN